MAVTAQLGIHLCADSVLVAESSDLELWRKVFAAVKRAKAFTAEGASRLLLQRY